MVKIGILGGTGPAGSGLAARLCAGGQKVYVGSRDPLKAETTVRGLVERWGARMAHIESASNADVAETAEIVVLGTTARATVATASPPRRVRSPRPSRRPPPGRWWRRPSITSRPPP